MSTQAIRELIRLSGRATLTAEAWAQVIVRAEAEVEAIDEAAQALKDVPVFLNTPNLMEKADAYDLMERIAAQRTPPTTPG